MIADLLEFPAVLGAPGRPPWFLIASNLVFAALLAYVLFGGYLPARQRETRLEAELREVYAREAALQSRLAQLDKRQTSRDQQAGALRAERDALARRVEDLERQLAGRRRSR
jgi:hypothetical protein